MNLGFIGGGNMAAALIGGLLRKGYAAETMRVAEPLAARRAWLASEFGVAVEENAAETLGADVILLAVKPQQLAAVLRALPAPAPEQLVLSIAAGVRAGDIARWLGGHPSVVRAMPNTPALVGAGVTGLYALPGVNAPQKDWAEQVLSAVGEVLWVDDEGLIDAVTAISGSGPAYVFYFMEALEQAALALGLQAADARRLSLHTFFGAAALALQDASSPAELRAKVTSKGGTTERGLRALEAAGVADAILSAARAAAARAGELGDLLGRE